MSGRSSEAEWAIARLSTGRGRLPAYLGETERDAAERLRADFTRGCLMPSVTQRWDATPRQTGSRGAGDLSDNAIDARTRVDAALRAVGPELSGLLLDLCCHLKGLETVERERQWPPRSAKVLVKVGLGILARHYGFDRRAGAPEGRIRRWGTADSRPSIDAARDPVRA